MSRLSACLVALVLCGGPASAATPYEEECARIAAARGREPEARRLHALFDASWRYALREFPEFATSVGAPGQDDRWTDRSLAAIARRKREAEAPARALATIERRKLSAADRLSYDLFRRDVDETLEGRRFPSELMPVTQLNGVQQDAARVIARTPATTIAGYEHVVARLRGLPAVVDQVMVLLEEGRRRGLTPPRVTLRDVPDQVARQLRDDPLESPLLLPFTRVPATIAEPERERLRREATDAYTTGVAPAFRRLGDYLTGTYIPAARETIALGDLPDGAAWYAFAARTSTTTALSPADVHAVGLGEVTRIRREMEAAARASGFEGSIADFARFLRSDARFYWDTPEALLAGHRDIAKRADAELVKLFGKLPRLPYGVEPVPAYVERSQPAAYYEAGSLAAGRPGIFFANTSDLPGRPKWGMEALTLHEAVPGHHLQIALAQELDGVPEFRRHGGYTAFVEGWGLYAESLGTEMGFYKDPYAQFGRLSYEMWRAVRLVVDTGIHAFGWSRERAIDYFREQTGKPEAEAVVEVDRYIVWPGQALAYKIGELELKKLRVEATTKLGDAFDLRAFHDEVLGAGALPLDVLAERVRAWIAAPRRARSPGA